MNIEFDLESILATASIEAFQPERIQALMNEHLTKSVDDAISEAFSYRSPFNTMLKEKISQAMPADLENLGRFGDVVLKQVNSYIQQYMEGQAQQMLQQQMAELLEPFNKEITMSKLAELLRDKFYDGFYGDCDESAPTIIIDRGNEDGWFDLYADAKQYTSKYSCELKARFRKNGVCWSFELKSHPLNNKDKYFSCLFNTDALILNIYTGQTKVILDETDFSDLYYENYED